MDLDVIKIALFDFDDTLCIHSDHTSSKDDNAQYNKDVLTLGSKTWNKCSTNRHMKEFMNLCLEKDIKMGLISATRTYPHAREKKNWVCERYGLYDKDMDNFCVGTFEDKLRMLIAVADSYEVPRRSVLLVDDFWKNLEAAADAGFQTCTPMQVVNYIDELENGEPLCREI